MPINQSGKRHRVPWRVKRDDPGYPVTVPVYMAYCSIAASLRDWNRSDIKAIVTLLADEDFYFPVFAEAARYFAAQIWKPLQFHQTNCWFPCGTEPVFPPRSEPPLSMVF